MQAILAACRCSLHDERLGRCSGLVFFFLESFSTRRNPGNMRIGTWYSTLSDPTLGGLPGRNQQSLVQYYYKTTSPPAPSSTQVPKGNARCISRLWRDSACACWLCGGRRRHCRSWLDCGRQRSQHRCWRRVRRPIGAFWALAWC